MHTDVRDPLRFDVFAIVIYFAVSLVYSIARCVRARWDELTFKINCVEFAFLLVFRYSGKKRGKENEVCTGCFGYCNSQRCV